jgi:5-methylcytosine-specific restriction protein A
LMVLAEEPLCRQCLKEGRTTEARHVDHIVPRPEGDDSRGNLQSLCAYHHGVKTARQDGAFGRRVVPKEER